LFIFPPLYALGAAVSRHQIFKIYDQYATEYYNLRAAPRLKPGMSKNAFLSMSCGRCSRKGGRVEKYGTTRFGVVCLTKWRNGRAPIYSAGPIQK
jgi:hypothetical protein